MLKLNIIRYSNLLIDVSYPINHISISSLNSGPKLF
jgi:hypothetical protein